MATNREDRTATFFLTTVAVGCLTQFCTYFLLMRRFNPWELIPGVLGLVLFIIDILDLGLSN